MALSQPKAPHRWRFFRAGGVDQVKIETGADIANLAKLDQKLWVALSCPAKGLEFDQRTLEFLDADKDGRVRVNEVLAAIDWLKSVLKNLDGLVPEEDGVPLSAIDDRSKVGQRVLAAARMVLANLGKADAATITVADTMETAVFFQNAKLNGDGIVPPDAIDDATARQVALDIIACLGSEADRSGKPGVSAAKVKEFFVLAAGYAEWWKKSETDKASVLPLGEATGAACAAFEAAQKKVDDYFARCRLAAYDPRAETMLQVQEKRFLEIAAQDMTLTATELAGLPLAKVEAGRALDLTTGINPAWQEAITTLRHAVVVPLFAKDKTSLTDADWATITAKFAAHRAWRATKPASAIDKLPITRIREILAGKTQEALLKAVEADQAIQPEIDAITEIERLARYWRDLHHLLNNFVAFTDFYSRRRPAIFQAGTLFLDSRSCDLCVRVEDGGKHGALSTMARTFLAYCDCTRKSGEKMSIAAAFTAGDSDHLMVGRNGVFYDRQGRDWDATVTRVLDHPISIGQAFWAPYKRFLRWIEEQVAKRAEAADAAASESMKEHAVAAGDTAATGEPKPALKSKIDIGVVAALGVAVGGIATAVTAMLNKFFDLGVYMPLGVVGVILLISGPSMAIAWLKLRQRNLGPLLDANGWAVNGRVKVNIPLGASLTDIAALPAGSERSLTDPFAAKKPKWPKRVLWFVIFVLILFGLWESKLIDKQEWYQQALHFVGLDTKTEHAAKTAAAPAPLAPPADGQKPAGK